MPTATKSIRKYSGGKYTCMKLAQLREMFGGVCQWADCKETEDLQFAHIVKTKVSGMGRGSWIRYKDIMEHPASYRLFCVTHHMAYDDRQIKLEVDDKVPEIDRTEELKRIKNRLFIDVMLSLEGPSVEPIDRQTLIVELIKTGKFTVNECVQKIRELQRNSTIYESKPNMFNLVQREPVFA